MEAPSREHKQLKELSHLRKKVSSLEVMLQKMSLEREPTPELEEEGMESFLRRMAAEYIQTDRTRLLGRNRVFKDTNKEATIRKTGLLLE